MVLIKNNLHFNEIHNTLIELRNVLYNYLNNKDLYNKFFHILDNAIQKAEINNPWFTRENILKSLKGVHALISDNDFLNIAKHYPKITKIRSRKDVGVILAGNIPLVGIHDFICVLITGNNFIGKQSAKDNILLISIYHILSELNPNFKKIVRFEENLMKKFDAVIATGSNNSSKYFEYYFKKYPNIIRKNRNSVAILSGNETQHELSGLIDDIMLYFGLGCRNISKIYIPTNYPITNLYEYIERYNHYKSHNKYFNNYEYNRAIYLVNKVEHFDNGYLILKEDIKIASPISVLYYEFYIDINIVKNQIENNSENIQCIISNLDIFKKRFNFGSAQYPGFLDFSDNVDTIEFLLNL